MNLGPQQMSLVALADLAGLPGRTIRFYIARGLLPGPIKAGRDAVYGPEHLARLREIRELQTKGLTLLEIAHAGGEAKDMPVSEPTAWWQYPLAPDVVVNVRADVSPWRLRQIKHQLAQMSVGLGKPSTSERNES
jgi:DNA-binding transcriptional MerR regulator